MKLSWLRNLLIVDAAVLLLLGGFLVFAPRTVEAAFHFEYLPEGVSYVIGLWGCALVTMGLGYIVAAIDPVRHIAWVQVAIARGVLECILGLVYLAKGLVTFSQAGPGVFLAALISVAYVVLYPRGSEAASTAGPASSSVPQP